MIINVDKTKTKKEKRKSLTVVIVVLLFSEMNVSYSIEGGWENRFGGTDNDASVWATRKLR